MPKLNVLVVGASIAGPSAAYWLAKAGANVTVIERFPKFRTSGQAVDIRNAGVTIMRKIPGMEAAVRAKATSIEGVSFVRNDGRPYGVLRSTGDPDQQSLVSEFEIFRGDLAEILYDMTKDNKNIKYVFGEQIKSIRQNEKEDGPVTVDFENGFPTLEYDLIVACDGATSRTRAIGLGCDVRDHIHPLNCWAAYFSIKEDLLKGSKIGHGFSAVPGRFLSLGPDPTGINRVTFIRIYPRNDQDATAPFRQASKKGDKALKEFVAQTFEGCGWRADELVKVMLSSSSSDFYASELMQVKTPSLYRGRFVMVGDAGYATGPTGGGTTLAMTGAYVLAGEILKHDGDLAEGLRAYEERMKPIIIDLQKIPPGIPGVMAPQTEWGLWLRNVIFIVVSWSSVALSWLGKLAPSLGDGNKYKLSDYEWVA